MQPLSLYRRLTLAIFAIALCTVAVSGAFATALPTGDGGLLNILGTSLGVTQLGPTAYCFSFSGGSTCAGAAHTMAVSGGGGLSTDFSTAPTSTIKDFVTAPVTGFESVVGGTGVGGLTVNFDLTSVHPGVDPTTCSSNIMFATCTPAGSPFNILQTGATQIAISFSVGLNGYTGTSASGVTPYTGVFSTQIAGTLFGTAPCSGLAANITNVVSCVGAGGTLLTTWSATELPASSTPEPGTLFLMGSGLAGLAGYIRRFKRS